MLGRGLMAMSIVMVAMALGPDNSAFCATSPKSRQSRHDWQMCPGMRRQLEDIRLELRDAFYPDDDVWKLLVWSHAVEVVESALRSLQPMGYRSPGKHP